MLPIEFMSNVIRPVQYKMLDKKKLISCCAKDMQPKIDAVTPRLKECEKQMEERKEKCAEEGKTSDEVKTKGTNRRERMWNHRIDLKQFDPEDVKIENSQDDKCIIVNAKKASGDTPDSSSLEVRRKVFIPNWVDPSQISSYMNNAGYLVIHAPISPSKSSKTDPSSCQKCDLKRKHSSIEDRNKMPDVREDFQKRTESSFEDDDADSNSSKRCKLSADIEKSDSKEDGAKSSLRKQLSFSVDSLLGRTKSEEESKEENEVKDSNKEVKMEFSENSSKSEDQCEDKTTNVDSEIPCDQEDSEDSSDSDKVVSSAKDTGSNVVLTIPMKSFFPEENKVNITLMDNTLTFRAIRKMKVGGGELSEMFLKEFSFPSNFDTKTMRLSRDRRGNVIICISKKST